MSKTIELLKDVTGIIENGDVASATSTVSMVKRHGIYENMHVGKDREFFDNNDHVAEWLLGQYLDIISRGAWFAMNSLINTSHSFFEERDLA